MSGRALRGPSRPAPSRLGPMETTSRDRPLVPAPLARGRHGAVVAPHHLATAAGLAVLAAGGSAVDAAIATNAVLGVVVPHGCGIGGDAFWLIWDRRPAGRGAQRLGSRAARRRSGGLRAAGLDRSRCRARTRSRSRGPCGPGATPTRASAGCRASASSAPRSSSRATGSRPGTSSSSGRGGRPRPRRRGDRGRAFDSVYRPQGRPWRPGELVRLPALAATLERLAERRLRGALRG